MAQISRPFQIALVAIALFALVWLLALRGHSANSGGSGSSARVPSSSATTPNSVYHGSAPGVEGLSRAVTKARGAVATSQQNAKQLAERSAQASGGAAPTPSAPASASKASSSAGSTAAAKPGVAKVTTHRAAAPTTARQGATSAAGASARPSMQVKVEAELKQGKTVTILFWNPKASDDVAVKHQLQSVGNKLRRSIVVHDALASQVGSFGTIIRGVKVYGTPTVMIINKNKQALTLTGYTDAYSIEQAIGEARHV